VKKRRRRKDREERDVEMIEVREREISRVRPRKVGTSRPDRSEKRKVKEKNDASVELFLFLWRMRTEGAQTHLHNRLPTPLAKHHTLIILERHPPDRLARFAQLPDERSRPQIPKLDPPVVSSADDEPTGGSSFGI